MPDLRTVPPRWLRAFLKRAIRAARGKPTKRAELERANSAFATLVADRKRWLFETLPPASAILHDDILTKASQRRWAQRLGLDMAEVYLEKSTLADAFDYVEERGLERFAIKPNSSRSSIGFRPLVREGAWYRDLRKGKPKRMEQVRRELADEFGRLGRPDEWILEELLVPFDGSLAPLQDFKLYCIGGRVELIYHSWKIPRAPWKRRNWYTREWEPVLVSVKGPNEAPASAPIAGQKLLDMAEAGASQLLYPFIRMDLYDTSVGVRLGELTPSPGGAHNFLPEWDERLSRRWRQVADDLAEGIRTGRVDPLLSEVAPAPHS